jgi:dTDP-4-dehydrorhamnose reductase
VIRILITGKNGQVGWELQRALCPLGEVIAADRRQMDFASPEGIRDAIRRIKPRVIVNAAAYTAVDRAETEPGPAMAVNGIAPGIVAQEAQRLGAFLIHYSTDYVFDGSKDAPYVESDPANPLGVYGRSKLAGEQAIQATGLPHCIFRTSWVYSTRGHNFSRTMLRLARERNELRIVDDQLGAPTWARGIAEITAQVLAQAVTAGGLDADRLREQSGLYHLTAAGTVSWFAFAQAIFAGAGAIAGEKIPRLIPIRTIDYPLPARRPANSRLDNSKFAAAFGLTLPDWEAMLRLCIEEAGIRR